MNPRKYHEFYQEAADEHGVERLLFERLIETYWLEIRKAMSNFAGIAITVRGLGEFRIRYNKLYSEKKKFEKLMETANTTTFKGAQRYKFLEVRYNELTRITDLFHEDRDKKKESRKLRAEIYDKYLEKPGSHLEE